MLTTNIWQTKDDMDSTMHYIVYKIIKLIKTFILHMERKAWNWVNSIIKNMTKCREKKRGFIAERKQCKMEF